MISDRNTADGNANRARQAVDFAGIFFQQQDKDKQSLHMMYHEQSTLIWNGTPHKTRTSIQKFYQSQHPTETTLQALDAQIMPPVGDIIDMVTVVAGGKIKHSDNSSNFTRTFLLGPRAPGSSEYVIVSDTMRIQN